MSLVPADTSDALAAPPPEHDVIAKCQNGRFHRPVDDVYGVIRIVLDSPDGCPDADLIAYSYDNDFGSKFVEQIACREMFGRFWDYEKEGSPCFDPYTDGGQADRPLPRGRFMMWDPIDESANDEHGLPKQIVPTLTLYGEGPDHIPFRRYKIAKAQLTIHDLMSIETDGDRFFGK